jgi:AhpD family alkylhydroperoxidase
MERLDYKTTGAEGYKLLGQLSSYTKNSGLPHNLIELVKLRSSQINGCANCVNLHAGTLRKLGESEERIQLVVAWSESTCFSDQEKAALAWAESVTLVADTHVPDAVYEEARRYFSEKELVDLTFAIVTINAHNRLAVAFRIATPSNR